MSRVDRIINTTPQRVWDVLADGWLYPLWVVGATRMRDVDAAWPAEGSQLHHSVGTWPLVVDDDTTVLACAPGQMLELRAKAWPGGEAQVRLHLSAHGSGTRVVIEEDVVSGPGKLMPGMLRKPALHWRNTETLRRLAFIAEHRPSASEDRE